MERKQNNNTSTRVRHRSGSNYHFNLDGVSLSQLKEVEMFHTGIGCPTSQSAIVRRAIRVYWKKLSKLKTDRALEQESIELKRAAKGVT